MIETGRPAPAASLYDAMLDDPGNDLHKTCFETSYAPLYEAAVSLVPKHQTVVELGSGTGQFAYLLWLAWPTSPIPYLGIDFSPRSVDLARERFPLGEFVCRDFTAEPLPAAETYVVLATLEDLDDDRAVVERMTKGAYVVISVPSFDADAHVRYFPKPSGALARYEDLIAIERWESLPVNAADDFIHLFAGRRRA